MTTKSFRGFLDQKFHLSARNTNVASEFVGGTSNFLATIYIVPVGAGMLALAGRNADQASLAIALITCIVTALMGIIANLPIILSTGVGITAFVTYSICLGMGYDYNVIMWCTLIEGIAFLVLTLTGLRTAFVKALPHNLKMCIGGGIGGFVAYIGLQNASLIVNDDSTLTTCVNFREDFSTRGISALLAGIGLLVIIILTVRKVKAAVVIGVGAAWVLGMICQAAGIYVPNAEAGYYSLYPSFHLPEFSSGESMFISTSSLQQMGGANIFDLLIITLTMFYSDFFDTVGTCLTCIEKIKNQIKDDIAELKKSAKTPEKVDAMEHELEILSSESTTKRSLLVDAIGTIIGAIFKCTTITSFVESGASIESGGRTGLSSIFTAIWFFLAIFFASVFTSIPGFATGPALVAVGCSMLGSTFGNIKWEDGLHQVLPGILCIIFTILTYNIANGMAIAIISYVVVSVCTGNRKEISPIFYVIAPLLVAKFIFL